MAQNQQFNQIQLRRPGRNMFDLTHDVKQSLNMGWLVPIMALEYVPGDKFKLGADMLIKFAPMISPAMHRFDATIHYFASPNRLVWPGWEDYITDTKTEGLLPVHPYFLWNRDRYEVTRLGDYMGLPLPEQNTNPIRVSALPFAHYQLIYNEYYRDQNLVPEVTTQLTDGDNTDKYNAQFGQLRNRAWEHDYFTSALPWAQKGDPVNIPIGNFENVPVLRNSDPTLTPLARWDNTLPVGASTEVPNQLDPDFANTRLYAATGDMDLEATTINDLRTAFRLQEWLEKQALGGNRYIESTRVHFGVVSSDNRYHRPTYITGTKTPITISEILNTTGTEDLPQGNMSGHAIGVSSGNAGSFYAEEHGYIIGIMSIMPKPAYQQGVPKHFLKIQDPKELYWPEFAHLGEQEVFNKELYANGDTTLDEGVFGYQSRYIEYKNIPSRVAGEFKNTLSHWHAGRIFGAAPTLSQQFIEMTPDQVSRLFAIENPDLADAIYCHVLNKVQASRLMPKFGTPMF